MEEIRKTQTSMFEMMQKMMGGHERQEEREREIDSIRSNKKNRTEVRGRNDVVNVEGESNGNIGDRVGVAQTERDRLRKEKVLQLKVDDVRLRYVPTWAKNNVWKENELVVDDEEVMKSTMAIQTDVFIHEMNKKWNAAKEKSGNKKREVSNVERQIFNVLESNVDEEQWAQVLVNSVDGCRCKIEGERTTQNIVRALANLYL